MSDERTILLQLCGSLTLADHLGDVAEYVWKALKMIGIDIPPDVGDLEDLGQYLAETHGATTLNGTSLLDD